MRQGIFGALADVTRQDVGEGLTQDPFLLAIAKLQFHGQAHSQSDKGQVEERHTRFHALSHARAVDALQFGPPEVVQLVLENALS